MDMGRKTQKSHESEHASADNLGRHQLEVFRAFAHRGAIMVSGWRAHQPILEWRLVGGSGKPKDGAGKPKGDRSGFHLVRPKPAEVSLRFSGAGRERQQHKPVLSEAVYKYLCVSGVPFGGGGRNDHQNGLASTQASPRTVRNT